MFPFAALAAAWLFVSDIHLNPVAAATPPARYGSDANAGLLDSAIAEMRRVDPSPPVVVIGGDFVAHHIDRARVVPTIAAVARRFDRAFPHAQFVIALGNNDAACGDYGVSVDGPFLRAVAQAWAPLVNRRNAAPDFARTFAHDGFYTARLPGQLEAVVIDDITWSPLAHRCGSAGDAGDATLAELGRALSAPPRRPRWILMHVPPGIDAFTTLQLAKRLAIVPLLDGGFRARFEALVGDRAHDVALVLAGHIHRFSYRVIGVHAAHPVPLLTIPSISPVYDNAPAFLTTDVAADGTVRNAEEYVYDRRVAGAWRDAGGLRTLGIAALSVPALLNLQQRLASDPELRTTYGQLYDGRYRSEIDEGNWRAYWCAATELAVTPYRKCLGAGGWRIVTRRGFIVLGVVFGIFVAALAAAVVVIRRRGRTA